MCCIFLIKPQYFIYDIEKYLSEELSSIFSGTFDISMIEGNFINGLKNGLGKEFKNGELIFEGLYDEEIGEVIPLDNPLWE